MSYARFGSRAARQSWICPFPLETLFSIKQQYFRGLPCGTIEPVAFDVRSKCSILQLLSSHSSRVNMDEEKATPYPSPHNTTPWRLISEAAQSLKSNQSIDEDLEKPSDPTQEDESSREQQRDEYHETDIEGSDPDLVDWDGPHDTANPMNWS